MAKPSKQHLQRDKPVPPAGGVATPPAPSAGANGGQPAPAKDTTPAETGPGPAGAWVALLIWAAGFTFLFLDLLYEQVVSWFRH